MRRTHCSGCKHDHIEPILDLGLSPIADAYTETPDNTPQRYPLQLGVCTACWLVQLLDIVSHDALFGTGYSFFSSASPPLSSYQERYARDVIDRCGGVDGLTVIEIGCNDGDMLRHFAAAGANVIGVDPAGPPVAMARERGLNVWNTVFDTQTAQEMRDAYAMADVVIANHVLAHVEDVDDVLAGIAHVLKAGSGLAWIEVQYLPDLLISNAFDLVYHEHRNFFSLTTLRAIAKRHGLHVIDATLTDRQSGSLRVIATRTPHPHASLNSMKTPIELTESWLLRPSAYVGLQNRVERAVMRLGNLIADQVEWYAQLACYGAPAKATTLLNFCDIPSEIIPYAVDTTVAKQGRFIPGTGQEIIAPTDSRVDDVETFLLTAWNYAPQIMRKHREYVGHDNTGWIIPIPVPTLW